MAGLVDIELCIELIPDETDITDEVEQLVARRFVGEIDVGGVEHTVVHLEVADVLFERLRQTFELLGGEMLAAYSEKSFISAVWRPMTESAKSISQCTENFSAGSRSNTDPVFANSKCNGSGKLIVCRSARC